MATRFAVPVTQVVNDDASGIGSGWKLNFYTTGTSTRKDTFSDNALSVANANPVVADSSGRFGDVFLESGAYKVVLTDGDDVVKWTADPVAGSLGATGEVDEKTAAYTVTTGDATKTIAVDATSGALTVTLPTAATATDGFEVTIKKTDSSVNAVTIDGNGAETIDGAATLLLTTQYRSATLRCDGSNWLVVSTANEKKDSDIISAAQLADGALGFSLVNGTLTASVAANALTIAIKTKAGADPSAADPVLVLFRNVTAATGDYTVISITAATSLVISSGSTLGASNGVAFRVWIVGFNDGGTFRLGAINCLSGTGIFPLGQFPIASSTAEGGAGAADTAQVFYTGSAVTSKAYAVLGYATWESGLTTAGTWDAAPTRLHLFGPHTPLPGQVVQDVDTQTGAVSTGTTVFPDDDTIPQQSGPAEGDEYMTRGITAISAANVFKIEVTTHGANTTAGVMIAALFRDAVASAIAAQHSAGANVGANNSVTITFTHLRLAGSTAAQTFKVRMGLGAAGTTTFNGASGARKLGGVLASSIVIMEHMG